MFKIQMMGGPADGYVTTVEGWRDSFRVPLPASLVAFINDPPTSSLPVLLVAEYLSTREVNGRGERYYTFDGIRNG